MFGTMDRSRMKGWLLLSLLSGSVCLWGLNSLYLPRVLPVERVEVSEGGSSRSPLSQPMQGVDASAGGVTEERPGNLAHAVSESVVAESVVVEPEVEQASLSTTMIEQERPATVEASMSQSEVVVTTVPPAMVEEVATPPVVEERNQPETVVEPEPMVVAVHSPEPIREEPVISEPMPAAKPVVISELMPVEHPVVLPDPIPLSKAPLAQPVTVMWPDRVTIRFASNAVRFSFPDAVDPAALRQRFETCATCRITITGHADQKGHPRYNLWLSEKRAKAVQRALQQAGIAAERMVVRALGSSEPVVSGVSTEALSRNRRVEIDVQRDPKP
ncbi:MAG: OmpA family protein [Magnetococcales bacterium]|nr:OmpA family protein [Magnetococcales bacterium]